MSSDFHPKFPWGSGIWIWQIENCLGGSLPAILQKMKDNNLSYALVKCADGVNTWDQWNQDLVNAFHNAGIKILAWSFVYGQDPVREGDIALWALDMGADGFVFDAEEAWESLPNPGQTATTMLQTVRAKHPEAFIAYSTFPIIDLHPKFPYIEFGKYCDVAMPQIYWNDFQKSPTDAVNWMYDNWARWEAACCEGGHGDSSKPLIPTGSAYDIYSNGINYTLKPSDLAEFINAVKGYKSVNFWEFSKITRPDCWSAIQANNVTPPTPEDLGQSVNPSQNTASTNAQVTQSPTIATTGQTIQSVTTTTTPSSNQTTGSTVPLQNPIPNSQKVLVDKVDISGGQRVVVKHDPSSPSGVQVQVHDKVLIDYIQEFLAWAWNNVFRSKEVK